MTTKEADPRTLWVVTKRADLQGHTAYAIMDEFEGCLHLKSDSIIRPTDVLFFDGGTDVNPSLYGEDKHLATGMSDTVRDAWEKSAFRRARDVGAACLGTCRGAQLLCVLSGGKLVQHVTGHGNGHDIYTDNGEVIYTESSHHQVMWPFNIAHVLIAYAKNSQGGSQRHVVSDEYGKDFPNGEMPEVVYCKDTRCLCIQGHSEWVTAESKFRKQTHVWVREFLINTF